MNRRLCSVWSGDEALYHYYAAPVVLDGGNVQHRRLPPPLRAPLGDPPELLLRQLPAGALYVGRGRIARGEIVTRRRPGGSGR